MPRFTKKRPSVPFEQNAVITFAGDDHFNIVRHIDFDLERSRRVVLILNGWMTIFVFNRQFEFDWRDLARARFSGSECPASDVDVMRAPVGEFAARVFVPIAE